MQIDSTVADAYLVLGLSDLKPGPSFLAGAAYLERAIRLEPNNPTAHFWLSSFTSARGDPDSALAEIRRARALDPMSNAIATGEMRMLSSRGDYAAGRRAGELLLARDSLYGIARTGLAVSLIFSGAPDNALAVVRPVSGQLAMAQGLKLFALAAAGRWSDAERLRDSLAQGRGCRGWNDGLWLSAMAFGEYDQAIDLLAAAWDSNFLSRAVFASVSCDPLLQPLRANARSLALLDRGGIGRCPNAATVKWPMAPRR